MTPLWSFGFFGIWFPALQIGSVIDSSLCCHIIHGVVCFFFFVGFLFFGVFLQNHSRGTSASWPGWKDWLGNRNLDPWTASSCWALTLLAEPGVGGVCNPGSAVCAQTEQDCDVESSIRGREDSGGRQKRRAVCGQELIRAMHPLKTKSGHKK